MRRKPVGAVLGLAAAMALGNGAVPIGPAAQPSPAPQAGAIAREPSASPAPGPADTWTAEPNVQTPLGLPPLGKWMLSRQGVASDWLGEVVAGRNLREPINVILVDRIARSPEEAKDRLLAAASGAGYPVRFGHSTGYQAFIGDRLYGQLPTGRDDAFSNDVFELSNNHGRVFGPHATPDGFVFIAAFSREEVDPFRVPGHQYGSFNRARDDFTQRLNAGTSYRIRAFVPMDSALIDDPRFTTGDHDGIAVLLQADGEGRGAKP